MSRVRGPFDNTRALSSHLRKLARDGKLQLAIAVAEKVAPTLTAEVADAYDSGQTVFGDARPAGKTGALSLVQGGDTRKQMFFRATGHQVRCAGLPPYAGYLIAKYRILPTGRMPFAWSETIRIRALMVMRDMGFADTANAWAALENG
jgi:hypothetical protein